MIRYQINNHDTHINAQTLKKIDNKTKEQEILTMLPSTIGDIIQGILDYLENF